MLQNATPLRKSAPWPPNISSLVLRLPRKMYFKCLTPAIVFGNATKPSRFAHFWPGAQSLPLCLPRKTTSDRPKVLRARQFFALLTSKCASCHSGVHFFDMSTSKSSPTLRFCSFWHGNVLRATTACTFSTSQLPKVLRKVLRSWGVLYSTFWLGNVLRVTTACAFSTSQLPKVLRHWGVLYILTWKFASRHNNVHFFDTAWHRNFQKCSEAEVFCAIWLRNVLRATTARNCSSFICPDGSAPAALASLLFDPPEPQIIGKTQCFATFLPFRASASSFFWLSLLWSSFFFSSLLFSDSSHLCFSSVHFHTVGSLTSKPPWIILPVVPHKAVAEVSKIGNL